MRLCYNKTAIRFLITVFRSIMVPIYPSTALKNQQREIKKHANSEVVHITENGRGKYVFMSQDVLNGLLEHEREQAVAEYKTQQRGNSAGLCIKDIAYCVVDLAQEYGAQEVSLFGSFARNEATPESDVDLLLEKGDIHGLEVLDFQAELERRLDRKVDLVTTAGADERFLANARKDAVVLYAAG